MPCPDCTDALPCWRKEKQKTAHFPMHRCSGCTGCFDCKDVHPKCTRCDNTVHVCARCDPVDTCVQCTKRPHICLSKCIRGCIYKKAHACNCSTPPRRFQVQKEGPNKGRYFWSCRVCALFEWDAWLLVLATSRFRLLPASRFLIVLRLYIHQTPSPMGVETRGRRPCRWSRRRSRSFALLVFDVRASLFF